MNVTQNDNYFSGTVSVTVSEPVIPFAMGATNVTTTSLRALWTIISGASGYRFDLSLNSNFTKFSGWL